MNKEKLKRDAFTPFFYSPEGQRLPAQKDKQGSRKLHYRVGKIKKQKHYGFIFKTHG